MEEAPKNGKESPHSVHANGLIDCYLKIEKIIVCLYMDHQGRVWIRS